MPDWRATRPVDVARLNSSVFLAALRKFGILLAIGAPIYFASALLVGEHRAPGLGAGRILAAIWPHILTGVVSHLIVGLIVVMFMAAVGSLIWWRHILAVGGPSVALASLVSAARRIVSRLERSVDPSLLATESRRERATLAAPVHRLLDQLRAALLVTPSAPPFPLALNADRSVRTDQLISRRAA